MPNYRGVAGGAEPMSVPAVDLPHLRRNKLMNEDRDRKSTRLNSSHSQISYAVFCLKKKNKRKTTDDTSQRVLRSDAESFSALILSTNIVPSLTWPHTASPAGLFAPSYPTTIYTDHVC